MVKIREAIVVEGRYDKNTLSQVVDAPIFETNGFGIRKDKARMALLRRVAEQRGLIVFTDSDGAGFVIRNFLKGAIPAKYLKHAYIPDIPGKERRKSAPGKGREPRFWARTHPRNSPSPSRICSTWACPAGPMPRKNERN